MSRTIERSEAAGSGSYQAVPFSYGNNNGSADPNSCGPSHSAFHPPFSVPTGLLNNLCHLGRGHIGKLTKAKLYHLLMQSSKSCYFQCYMNVPTFYRSMVPSYYSFTVLEEKEEKIALETLLGTTHTYVLGDKDKSAAKTVDLLRGQKSYKVDATIHPEELEVMDDVLAAK